MMDLQAASIAHLNWKSKLTDFFYGLENLSPSDVPDHTRCDFGKWLYANGLKELAHLSETPAMEGLHKEVHEDIKALVMMPKEQRQSPEGQQALAAFKAKCDRLVDMLERMEKQVQ
ncbi:MAG: CZB domain-containing protein [Candidatus Electronema sp. VV]